LYVKITLKYVKRNKLKSKNQQPKHRREKIDLLESYLENPGRFSILVLGKRGTGKKYWIRAYQKSKNIPLHQINSASAKPEPRYWKEQFKKANKGILIVADVELLTKETQEVLFDGIATHNGKFGYEIKKHEFSIVFTSCKENTILRDTEKYLNHRFFDRIAQLVVEFPSFKCNNIVSDFKRTWKKFDFQTEEPILIHTWLRTNAQNLEGNFRDLDKLCIIWNNYQLTRLPEEEILQKIKEDFLRYHSFPKAKKEQIYELHFSRDFTYREQVTELRMALKKWADKEFSSKKEKEKVLGVSHRTMEGWGR